MLSLVSLQVQDALDILKPDQVLKVGGAGHKVLLLMEGQASAYVFPSPGIVRTSLTLMTQC